MLVHALIGLFQNSDEQLLLAAKVVIDQILADLAQAHDVIDTRPVVSLGGKFLGCNVENSLPRFVGVRRRAVGSGRRIAPRRGGARLGGRSLSALDRRGFLLCRLFADRLSITHDLGFQ